MVADRVYQADVGLQVLYDVPKSSRAVTFAARPVSSRRPTGTTFAAMEAYQRLVVSFPTLRIVANRAIESLPQLRHAVDQHVGDPARPGDNLQRLSVHRNTLEGMFVRRSLAMDAGLERELLRVLRMEAQ